MSYKVNNLMYAAGPDLIHTIRTMIALTEPVNPQALDEAVRTAAERFPYFSVRLVRRGAEYRMEHNPRPFVISSGGKAVPLGGAESNDHLFAFAYEGNRVFFDTTHFITDGNGKFPFIKSILYYYLSRLHPNDVFDTSTIALAGSRIPEAEADDDPYPDECLPEHPVGSLSRPAEVFMLPDQPEGYGNMKEWTSFVFRIRQKDMMAHASSVDGSPATYIASLMYKAVTECHPENRLPVVCGMQHQFRKALKAPLSHLCHVNIIPIIYPDRLRGRDAERLNTIARGAVILRADDANDVLTVNEHIRNEKRIRELPLSGKHDYMREAIRKGIGKNTFEVSYTGRVPWSGLDRYIRCAVPYLDMTLSGGISIEIFSAGDSFSVNIMQRNQDPRYVECFSGFLKENGIGFSMDAPEPIRLSDFRLPEEK